MKAERLSIAIEAISRHTGKAYRWHRETGMFMVVCDEGHVSNTILCAKTKQQLFYGICCYIQGYHAGRRSCT